MPAYLYTVDTAITNNFGNLSSIYDLFMDVARISALADAATRSRKDFWTGDASIAWGAAYLETVSYRLLSLCDPVNLLDLSSILQEMMRLSLLIFLGPIRGKFGIYVFKMIVQLGKLLAVLQEPIDLGVELDGLKLWIVTMGAMEASDTDMQDQFDSILTVLLLDLSVFSQTVWEQRLQDVM
jgi:hypothetical protein